MLLLCLIMVTWWTLISPGLYEGEIGYNLKVFSWLIPHPWSLAFLWSRLLISYPYWDLAIFPGVARSLYRFTLWHVCCGSFRNSISLCLIFVAQQRLVWRERDSIPCWFAVLSRTGSRLHSHFSFIVLPGRNLSSTPGVD